MYSTEFFMSLRKPDLKALCRSFGLPVSGNKDILASRLALRFEDLEPNSPEAHKVDQYLNQSIHSIDDQITELERQIRREDLSSLEHDISGLFDKHVVLSKPSESSPQSQRGSISNILARSSEPFVAKRKPRPLQQGHDARKSTTASSCSLPIKHEVLNAGHELVHAANHNAISQPPMLGFTTCIEPIPAYHHGSFTSQPKSMERYSSVPPMVISHDSDMKVNMNKYMYHDQEKITQAATSNTYAFHSSPSKDEIACDDLLLSLLPPAQFRDDQSIEANRNIGIEYKSDIEYKPDIAKLIPVKNEQFGELQAYVHPPPPPAEPLCDNVQYKQTLNGAKYIDQPQGSLLTSAPGLRPSDRNTSNAETVNPDFCAMAMNLIEHNAKTVAYAIQSTKMPVPEPRVFSGQVLEYNDWNKSIKRFVDANVTYTPADKLYYLTKYTAGEVLAIVNGYYALDDEGAYDTIRKEIHDRYGNPYRVAQAYQTKLASWSKVSNEPASLQRLVDFLKSIRTAMLTVPNLSYLNHPQENGKIKQLLPMWLKRKWNKHAVLYSKNHNETYPTFDVFVDFLATESDLINHPIALEGEGSTSGPRSVTESQKRSTGNISHNTNAKPNAKVEAPMPRPKPNVTMLSNSANSNAKPASASANLQPNVNHVSDSPVICTWCKSDHKLYKCTLFKAAAVKLRHDHVVKHKLCMNCLNNAHNRPCTLKLTCKACKAQSGHHYLLHDALVKNGDITEQPNSSAANQTASVKISHNTATLARCPMPGMSSYMVPVFVSHRSNPQHEILTYAMLDNQSNLTYVTDDIAAKIAKPMAKATIPVSTMTSMNQPMSCNVYSELVVRGYNCSVRLPVDTSYGCQSVPHNQTVPMPEDLSQWKHLAEVARDFPPALDCGVGMLIGHDCHYALFPEDRVQPTCHSDPYAVRTPLGWCLVGPVRRCEDVSQTIAYSHTVTSDSNVMSPNSMPVERQSGGVVPHDVLKQLESGFDMPGDTDPSNCSLEDEEFLDILSGGIKQDHDGLYSMPLPFRGGKPPIMPNNRAQAVSRLKTLNSKFKDPELFTKYDEFMKGLIDSGDAEPVPASELDAGNKWYLPHHNVVHPKKPNKVRIVFDGSCSFRGSSLNESLLTGPDLNNSLLGVLLRFRENNVAVACDIEKMFYRFKVHEGHRDFLRFLWYDKDMNIREYRMTKHIFGASSSPGCSKFALLQMADDHAHEMPLAKWFIQRCFYVDDGLYSCETAMEATKLLKDTSAVCDTAGLKVHKILSNDGDVLCAFPPEDLGCDVKQFEGGVSGSERALGIDWSPITDEFSFSYKPGDKKRDIPITRRNMLSLVSSIFDPLGLIAPALLPAKRILQSSFQVTEWDTVVPDEVVNQWESWESDLQGLNEVKIPRCIKQLNPGATVARAELHTFTDACEYGYGCCSYLRLLGSDGSISCSLLVGKSKVVPLKGSTVPRLELQAALMGAQMGSTVADELSIKLDGLYFWTDSEIVLAYINNTRKKLKKFVRNRVRSILELTSPDAWHHVTTDKNPADIASRGCNISQLTNSLWFRGPNHLSDPTFDMLGQGQLTFSVPENDPEVQKESAPTNPVALATTLNTDNCLFDAATGAAPAIPVALATTLDVDNCLFDTATGAAPGNPVALATTLETANCLFDTATGAAPGNPVALATTLDSGNCLLDAVNSSKSWNSAIKLSSILHHTAVNRWKCKWASTVATLQSGEQYLIKHLQAHYFPTEVAALQCGDSIPLRSTLKQLDPYMDDSGVLRVGGRMKLSKLQEQEKHPVIIPKESRVAQLIVQHYHQRCAHQGRGITMSFIRSAGYWIVNLNSVVRTYIQRCVICRKLRRPTETQKMSDLPPERVDPSPPFSYVGVDYFGPFQVKEGRRTLKRYGVIFTCLYSRAVHVEMADDMTTDAFILCMRTFIAIRGRVRRILCDRGSNFIGAANELYRALQNMTDIPLKRFLEDNACEFVFNSPSSSHMGGSWERQIRNIRNVFNGLMTQSAVLDSSSLRTTLYECMDIINNRPLTTVDAIGLEPLTPNHLIQMKSQLTMPPPGHFDSGDQYARQRWKRVQHGINQFWERFKPEYLMSLQKRQRWSEVKGFEVGDIVLLKEEHLYRGDWRLGKVSELITSRDGLVRRVKIQVGDRSAGRDVKPSYIERPVHKLVLLVRESDNHM